LPTHDEDATFWRDFTVLTDEQADRFWVAVRKFADDLDHGGSIRAGLRVRELEGYPGIFELTWAPDGRATFRYGPEKTPGKHHVIWRRVGTHAIFNNP